MVLIVLSTIGVFGSQVYSNNIAAAEKIETAKQDKIAKQKSTAANACRREKAKQKASQLGKVTYDELYDGSECDR